jgi:hypothetical protein
MEKNVEVYYCTLRRTEGDTAGTLTRTWEMQMCSYRIFIVMLVSRGHFQIHPSVPV